MVKSWKSVEREIAELLGGERIPILGRPDRDVTDSYGLWVDVKSRVSVSPLYLRLLDKAISDGYEGFIHNGVLFLPISDFIGKTKFQVIDKHLAAVAKTWLTHIAESCPSDRLPCIVLHRERQQYKRCVMAFDSVRYKNHDFKLFMPTA